MKYLQRVLAREHHRRVEARVGGEAAVRREVQPKHAVARRHRSIDRGNQRGQRGVVVFEHGRVAVGQRAQVLHLLVRAV